MARRASSHPAPFSSLAHRGYLIKARTDGRVSIYRDGGYIGSARDVADAKRIIEDELPRANRPARARKRRRSSSRHAAVKRQLTHAGAALLDARLGTAILHAGRAVHHATKRRNPPLPVRTFTGKSGHLVSEHVLALEYRHASSAQRTPYRHDFGGNVELWALRDGSLLLRGGHGQRLWEDFYVSDDE